MKTVVITGISKGLGLMLYNAISNNPKINIAGISRTSQNIQLSTNLLMVSGDITDSNIRKNFIQKTIQQFHNIDVLINNAGIVKEKKFIEYTDLDFIEMMDVNVFAAFALTQMCILQMTKQATGGHIINIGSTRSITGAPNKSLYSMSKFALRSMTQCINAELQTEKITSTIICPGKFNGIIETETADVVAFLIKNNITNIPEMIIGGQL